MSKKITEFSKQFIFLVPIKTGVKIHDNILVAILIVFIWPKIHFLQLKPCRGWYIFQPPVCQDYQLAYSLGQYWQSFDVIIMEENHRQDWDHLYADMLNRIRIGQQTEEDFKKLEERVRPENHTDLLGAMFISCKKNVEILNAET